MFPEEYAELKKGEGKATYVVAAENNGMNLDDPGNEIYPASYKISNVIPVGSLTKEGIRAHSSNYGKRVKVWEVGDNVMGMVPLTMCDMYNALCITNMSGTSFATPVYTGKLLVKLLSK